MTYMGTWTRKLPKEVLNLVSDPKFFEHEKLARTLKGDDPVFDFTCHMVFDHLADDWNNKDYMNQFEIAVKECYGQSATHYWIENDHGRRYIIYDANNKKKLWVCDVYPK